MATVISKKDAYAHLVAVIDRAMAGEEIAIEQSGAIKLRLLPVGEERLRRRTFGMLKGKVAVPSSSFDPLPEEELRAWEGE